MLFSQSTEADFFRAQVFPLFGLQMYDGLGLGWGNSLLGFLALAMCPIPFLFYKYGERLRNSKRFKVTF